MTTSIAGVTTPNRNQAYLSAAMFRTHRRSGVQVENLVPKGTPADQGAALLQYIREGSRWCDDIVDGHLGATVDTEQRQANVDRRGFVTVSPRFRPVLGLLAFAIGPSADMLTTLADLSGADVQEDAISVPVFARALMTSSQGPIQFGSMAAPYDRALCRYTYVNGFPVTTITADIDLGATSIAVADTTGIVAGMTQLTVYDGRNTFTFIASSVSTADSGGLGTGAGVVGCAAAPVSVKISDPWDPPMVSGMPAHMIDAVVLATRALIKETPRGTTSSTGGRTQQQSKAPPAGDDFAEAERLLRTYMVVTR